jgi:preprotein translocase subunit SecG
MILNLLLSLNLLVCAALIGVVLLQRSEGGALGTGGGPAGLITTRGAGDLLTRITWTLFTIFLLLSLGLTLYGGRVHSSQAIIDRLKLQSINPGAVPGGVVPAPRPLTQTPSEATPAPVQAPAAPSAAAPAPAPALTAPAPTVRTARTTRPAAPAAAAPTVLEVPAPTPAPRAETPAPLEVPKPPAPRPADADAPVKTNTPP